MTSLSSHQSLRSSLFLGVLLSAVLTYNQACIDPINVENSESLQVEQVLRQISKGVLVPQLDTVQENIDELYEQILQYQEDPTDELRSASQEKWKNLMASWQQVEMMQFGPAGSSLSFVAGENLRDEIYSWPTTNPCRVDQKTASGEYEEETFFADNLVNTYGLDALEHLLFSEIETVCPSQISPVSDGLWDSLGEENITRKRIAFALLLTKDLQTRNQELILRWTNDGDSFADVFAIGSAPYTSPQESLTDAFHALFYLETHTKDKKLAQPLGLKDCTEDHCVDDLEGVLSASSLQSIIANLKGFEKVFLGGTEQGFDDLLNEMGHSDLSDQIISDTQAAISYAQSLQNPLHEQIISDKDAVLQLHSAVSKITTSLKNELPIVLSLQVPTESAGDND